MAPRYMCTMFNECITEHGMDQKKVSWEADVRLWGVEEGTVAAGRLLGRTKAAKAAAAASHRRSSSKFWLTSVPGVSTCLLRLALARKDLISARYPTLLNMADNLGYRCSFCIITPEHTSETSVLCNLMN